MYFTKKRFSFDAFDGKSILTAQLDYPADGDGFRYEYFLCFVDGCVEFVSGKLFNAVKNEYLAKYKARAYFSRYCYELKIRETFSDDEFHSYLICAILKRATSTLSNDLSSIVFYREMIIPPKFLSRGDHKAILLNGDGIPVTAEYRDGQIVIENIRNKKSFINNNTVG